MFRVLVPIKRAIDYAVKIRVNSSKTSVDSSNVKHSLNPFCEIATEESIKLKDSGVATEVVVVSIGPKSTQDALRTALAMGADRAIHVETPADMRTDQDIQPLTVSKILHKIIQKESPQLILMGKQSIDGDNNQCGQMVSGLTGFPLATFASKIEVSKEKNSVSVTREIDGGLQKVHLNLPSIVTADLRLNTPRYATLPNIMKAKKKPLEVITCESLGITMKGRLEIVKVEDPPNRKAGEKIDTVDNLVNKLKSEAKII